MSAPPGITKADPAWRERYDDNLNCRACGGRGCVAEDDVIAAVGTAYGDGLRDGGDEERGRIRAFVGDPAARHREFCGCQDAACRLRLWLSRELASVCLAGS